MSNRRPKEGDTWKTALADQSLREAVTEKATLRYRNGHEEQDAEKKKGSPSAKKKDLNFIGVFGPILGSVLVDATRGAKQADLGPLGTGRTEEGKQSFATSCAARTLIISSCIAALWVGRSFGRRPNTSENWRLIRERERFFD